MNAPTRDPGDLGVTHGTVPALEAPQKAKHHGRPRLESQTASLTLDNTHDGHRSGKCSGVATPQRCSENSMPTPKTQRADRPEK